MCEATLKIFVGTWSWEWDTELELAVKKINNEM